MNKKLIIFAGIIFLFSINAFSQTNPNEHDTQFWNETTISFPLLKVKNKSGKETEKLSGFINGNLRIGQNIKHFVDERIGFGIEYKINKYLSFSPSYLYRAAQPAENKKEYEHRLRFDLNIEKKWKYFSIKNRNRVEHRIRNSKNDTTRYRNKIQLKIPVNDGDGKELFTPFVANELFYDFRQNSWFRNELSAGISKKLTKNATAELFYTLQTNRNVTVLRKVDVIGINLKFKID